MADYSDYKECTDCVHYELCLHQEKFLIEHNRKDLIRRYGFGLSEPEICCNFRDRSRFVELPCKVGDTLYTIVPGNKIREWIVADISFFSYSVVKIVITADSKDNNGTDHIRFGKHYLNHSVFLSREAAEQALKEREENGNL